MKIGIDIDGVLIDFEKELRTKAELFDLLILNGKGIIDKTKFNIEERYGWNKETTNKFIAKYFIDTSEECNIMPGAKHVIKLLKKDGHKLIIISKRGYDNAKMKSVIEKKLKREGLLFDKYYWGIIDKSDICVKEKIDIMIDDNPNVCKDISRNKIMTLYLRDVNKEKINNNNYIKEMNGWGEIYRYIYNK